MSMVYISEDGRKAYFDPSPLGSSSWRPTVKPTTYDPNVRQQQHPTLAAPGDQCCQDCRRRHSILPGVRARCVHWVREHLVVRKAAS